MRGQLKKIGIGIIGCGQRILDLFVAYPEILKRAKVIAVHDIDNRAAARYKEYFGKETIIYEDYQQLNKNKDIKWVFIGSINSAHKDQIIDSLENNKHIFCEKPLAISVEECIEIKRLFERKRLNFFIGFVLRFSNHYMKIKEIVESGKIGNVISMDFNETIPFNHGCYFMSDWRRFSRFSGGLMLEKCCHDIDIANMIANNMVKRVASFGGNSVFRKENSYLFKEKSAEKIVFNNAEVQKNPFVLEKDIADNQVVILEYFNKVHAGFHVNICSGKPIRRMYICGDRGAIDSELLEGKIELNVFYPKEASERIKTNIQKDEHGGGDQGFMKEIMDAMISGKVHRNLMDESVKSVVTCIAIDRSMRERRVVSLEESWKILNIDFKGGIIEDQN